MKRRVALLMALACCALSSVVADYSVEDRGTWPESWPKELEPLRKQSRTLEGPLVPQLHYQVPFTKREDFESAWPHLLKVKSKGAPLILMRSPYTRLGRIDAGVFIHTPPAQAEDRDKTKKKADRESTTYIELIVDGQIVNLNRIPLPADTPIIDERFKEQRN
jgi:hypothetical protein